jgi:DNA repair ATPase RecN
MGILGYLKGNLHEHYSPLDRALTPLCYNAARTMGNDEKILKALEDLQADVTAMKGDVGKIPAIEKRLGTLEAGQQALDVKVEAIHDYQKKAHGEIMDSLYESNEITGQAQKALEKRIERIEKHLGLPPLKQ